MFWLHHFKLKNYEHWERRNIIYILYISLADYCRRSLRNSGSERFCTLSTDHENNNTKCAAEDEWATRTDPMWSTQDVTQSERGTFEIIQKTCWWFYWLMDQSVSQLFPSDQSVSKLTLYLLWLCLLSLCFWFSGLWAVVSQTQLKKSVCLLGKLQFTTCCISTTETEPSTQTTTEHTVRM